MPSVNDLASLLDAQRYESAQSSPSDGIAPRAHATFIEGPVGPLEALWEWPGELAPAVRPSGAALFCHPHPLLGGTMTNKATYHSAKALRACGLATLRFNFRGVGRSGGVHDGGVGEIDDVAAAWAWMQSQSASEGIAGPMLLGGFSFGARASMKAAIRFPTVDALILVGLPVSVFPCAAVLESTMPLLVVQGSRDEFGPLDALRELLDRRSAETTLTVVEGASHLFSDHFAELHAAIATWVQARWMG